jgi:hypothetical protein
VEECWSLAHWYLPAIGSGLLWFVLVLLVLDTAYGLTRGVTRGRPAQENREVAQPAPPAYWMVVGMALALGLVTYLWRMVPHHHYPHGGVRAWPGRRRDADFLPLGLAGGYATTVGGGTLGSLCYALWDSSVAVGVSLALLAFFRRRLDRSGPP